MKRESFNNLKVSRFLTVNNSQDINHDFSVSTLVSVFYQKCVVSRHSK